MHSPIQLQEHKILRIFLDSKQLAGDNSELQFAHSISAHEQENHPGTWIARLDVQIKAAPESTAAPYVGEVAMIGIFTLSDDFPQENASDMVHLNAGAILYGAIRELINTLTAKAIHGPILLPTLDARTFIPAKCSEAVTEHNS